MAYFYTSIWYIFRVALTTAQLKSVNNHIESLEKAFSTESKITSDLRSKAYVSEEEAKKANAEIYRLQKQLEQHKRLLDGIPPELLKQLKNIKERGR